MVERAKASRLVYLPVASFIQNTASRAPTPGGGAVAALSGSLGAGLLLMVCRLTLGRKGYEEVDVVMRERVEMLMPLRDRLKELVDLDAEAFDKVMDAFGMAGGGEAETLARKEAIGEAYAEATRAPLEVMRLCLHGLERAPDIAAQGSANALSDAAVAALALHTGFVGAAYNVRINLLELPQGETRQEAERALAEWPARAEELCARARQIVDERMER